MACGICGQPGHNRRTCSAGGGRGGRGGSTSSRGGNDNNRRTSTHDGSSASSSPTAGTRIIHCGICGQAGHNRRTCTVGGSSASSTSGFSSVTNLSAYSKHDPPTSGMRIVYCGICGQAGHNRRTCTASSTSTEAISRQSSTRTYKCGNCGETGHNRTTCGRLTCEQKNVSSSERKSTAEEASTKRTITCGLCGKPGHNRRTCELRSKEGKSTAETATKRTITCVTCGEAGHNSRSCNQEKSKESIVSEWLASSAAPETGKELLKALEDAAQSDAIRKTLPRTFSVTGKPGILAKRYAGYKAKVLVDDCSVSEIVDVLRSSTASESQYQKDWRELARKLGLVPAEIEVLRLKIKNEDKTVFDVLLEMLEGWQSRLGNEATLGKLMDIATTLKWNNFAQKLEAKFSQ